MHHFYTAGLELSSVVFPPHRNLGLTIKSNVAKLKIHNGTLHIINIYSSNQNYSKQLKHSKHIFPTSTPTFTFWQERKCQGQLNAIVFNRLLKGLLSTAYSSLQIDFPILNEIFYRTSFATSLKWINVWGLWIIEYFDNVVHWIIPTEAQTITMHLEFWNDATRWHTVIKLRLVFCPRGNKYDFLNQCPKVNGCCESLLSTSSTIHLLSHLKKDENTEMSIRNPPRINTASYLPLSRYTLWMRGGSSSSDPSSGTGSWCLLIWFSSDQPPIGMRGILWARKLPETGSAGDSLSPM